jgi:molybdopterin converting factor small subunit
MRVTIKLFAGFQKDRFAREEREVAEGTRIRAVVEGLGIEVGEVGVLMVNGRHADVDAALKDGDVLAIFPVIGGG